MGASALLPYKGQHNSKKEDRNDPADPLSGLLCHHLWSRFRGVLELSPPLIPSFSLSLLLVPKT